MTRDAVWQPLTPYSGVAARQGDLLPRLAEYRRFRLDLPKLQGHLAFAPSDRYGIVIGDETVVRLPMPDGTLQAFRVVESPILSEELQALDPTVRTFRAQGIDDPTATARFGWTILGFHATILRQGVSVWIDAPTRGDQDEVIVYEKHDISPLAQGFRCTVVHDHDLEHAEEETGGDFDIQNSVGGTLRTYRLALNGTVEYTNFHGGTKALGEAAMVVAMNRVNGVYERDLASRMTIVYRNSWVGADSFDNNNGINLLGQNQTDLDSAVGNANYDIGHIFSTGGGGVASLGSLGITGRKARGVTGLPSPVGDPFYIDYVAHEIGHQYGANHTFNGTTGSCGGGNRSSGSAYEPGSGSTIMAYAGICGSEDVQSFSDDYFHARSFDEIVNHFNTIPSVGTLTSTGNSVPTANAGPNYTIPRQTPFRLVGTATDANGDALTYCWEQYNLGTASPTTNNSTRPLFRSFDPTTSPARVFPLLSSLLSGAATPWEILPTVDRSMTFRLTVRDNRAGGGGVQDDDTVITVAGTPFEVTAPNTAVTLNAGSATTVTWNPGSVSSGASTVDIWLSTAGGNDFFGAGPVLLADNVPNDGSQSVAMPWLRSTTARIMIQPTANVFFDVSNTNFTISESAATTFELTTSTVFGTQNGVGRITLSSPAPTGGIAFTVSDNSAFATVPTTVTVAAGATSQAFNIPTTNPSTTATATITVTRPGWTTTERKTAALTINPIPAPTAANDSYTATEDTNLNVAAPGVLGNDSSPVGALSATVVTGPTKGTLTLNSNGSFLYQPSANQTGADSFVYRVSNGTRTTDATVNLTITAVDEAIGGAVTLGDFGVSSTGIPVVIEVRNPGTTTVVRSFNAVLNSVGGFNVSYSTVIPVGNYDISAKASHWLRQTLPNVAVTRFGALGLKFTLINGDVDGDNSITVFDYDALSAAFDSAPGDANWNPNADLDGDGSVTVFDYDILSRNFDRVGDS